MVTKVQCFAKNLGHKQMVRYLPKFWTILKLDWSVMMKD